jgi:hypothetical protein
LAIPAGAQAILVLAFYNLNNNLIAGAFAYWGPIFVASIMFLLIGRKILAIGVGASKVSVAVSDRWVCIILAWLIVLFGVLDVIVNGVKILDPSTYAEFHGYGRYFRHFSNMCWVLIPIAVLCVKSRSVRFFLIFYGLSFPVIIVDRNRLLLGFFVFLFCYIIYYNGWKRAKLNILMFLTIIVIFGSLGAYRSGDSFDVASSGRYLKDGFLPLRESFFLLPSFLRQVVLYVTTPIVNYSVVFDLDFKNAEFFLSQMSPFNRDDYDAYPYSPILIKRFNVGTEFFPHLMYGGVYFSWISFVFMCGSFFLSILYLKSSKSIFALVIFLKVAHTVIFMGFAPQFFILYNFAFIGFFLSLQLISKLLIDLARAYATRVSGCAMRALI